jgi:hypothetical protein
MNTDNKSSRNLKDVQIILSALWAARMLTGIQGDVLHFLEPGNLEEMIEGTTEPPITLGLITVMTIIFMVPILMSFLSLTLKYPVNRWANLVIGIFFAVFDLVFLGLSLFVWRTPVYDTVLGVVYLVFTSLVVWYAWKWPSQERVEA